MSDLKPTIDQQHADYDAVYRQDFGGRNPGPGHGWIQWKGTNVCMDVSCLCGHSGHVDGDFFYYYRCSECDRTFAVGQNIKLIELTPEQVARVRSTSEPSILTDTDS